MACNDLTWVGIEDVEWLWGQFLHEEMAAREHHLDDTADAFARFAEETLDGPLMWVLSTDALGYWWCATCCSRHLLDDLS